MKRVLMLSDRLPIPVIGGDRLRAWHLADRLPAEVHLVCFSRTREDARLVRESPGPFASIELVPFPKTLQAARTAVGFVSGRPMQIEYHTSGAMARAARRVSKRIRPAALIAHLIRTAPYALPDLAPKRILEMTDVSSEYYRRAKRKMRGRGLLLYSVEEPRVRRFEIECVRAFDATVVVSERERERLIRAAGHPDRIHAIPNGVDEALLKVRPRPRSGLITFHGSMAYPPHADAAVFFAEQVLPKIPGASFRVVGAEPPRAVRELKGVEVTGTVDSIVPHLRESMVSVCPVRAAAGIQNKVLEAMALGVPVVTTPAVLAGIDARPGRDLLVAENAGEMAGAIAGLLKSPKRRQALSLAGRALIRRRYTWARTLKPYAELA